MLPEESMTRTAFVLLTRAPPSEWVRFLNEACASAYGEVSYYIVADDSDIPRPDAANSNIHYIQYDAALVSSHGYTRSCVGALTMFKECTAWDKALYHFCEVDTSYDFLWFVEDDVLIPTVGSIQRLTDKYSHTCDLAVHDNYCQATGDLNTWHWGRIHQNGYVFDLPWYKSMVCAVGVSSKLLALVKLTVARLGYIPFIECTLNTLAMHKCLTVQVAPELKHITFCDYIDITETENLSLLVEQDNWIHPQKNMANHKFAHNLMM